MPEFDKARAPPDNYAMSTAEIIAQIKQLPPRQRHRVFDAVEKLSQAEEDQIDNALADRALAESGPNIPFDEFKRRIGVA